jgi:hypothetical protein
MFVRCKLNTHLCIPKITNDLYKMSDDLNIKNVILGKSFNEALKFYSNLRVVKNNDKNLIITMDYCKDRCNVIIKNDKIIDINGFY